MDFRTVKSVVDTAYRFTKAVGFVSVFSFIS